MAKSRIDLHNTLVDILGNINVYFQPPENVKLKYPCIIYELNNLKTIKADNRDYLLHDRYTVTLIHRDPENDIFRAIQELPNCSIDRIFVTENLYHYAFTLFY